MMDGSVGYKLFQAFKIDFWSLTAWQVGMYGWSAIINFGLHLHFTLAMPAFWLMMAIGMACGFVTAYPMNWLLVKLGIKKECKSKKIATQTLQSFLLIHFYQI